MSDFGSAFSETPSPPVSAGEPLRITPDDIDEIEASRSLAGGTSGTLSLDLVSPLRVAASRYGVELASPERGEDAFVGVARNADKRVEEEDYWPVFSSTPRRRQHQVFTFEVEVPDAEGNPVEYIPVEVRGQEISGVLPTDGTPIAVYGSRDPRDGVIRTYKVLNLRNRSALRVKVRSKDYCFIATAAFGSMDAPQVQTLRRFRDRWLMPCLLGRLCVALYYHCSPPLARWISHDPSRRQVVRRALSSLIRLAGRWHFSVCKS